MKIIDFERKGNVVRFYLGEKTTDWGWTNSDYKDFKGNTPNWLKASDTFYGDDWDDQPYECNAGKVYDEFIKGYVDVSFPFDTIILEPCDGAYNSNWSKDDMAARKVPCLIVLSKELQTKTDLGSFCLPSFADCLGIDGIKKYYFGDELDG